ncbi:non-ribosomal peptide synthetase [Streptomyces chattanoogensis]
MERNVLEAETYWRDRLAGWCEPTVLGVEHPASSGGSRTVHEVLLTAAEHTALRAGAERLGTDLGLLALAAWSALLAQYGGGSDLLFGAAVPGRPGAPGAGLTPLRLTVDPDRPVRGLLDAAETALLGHRHTVLTPQEIHALSDLPDGVELYDKALRVVERAEGAEKRAEGTAPLPVEAIVTTGQRCALRLEHDTARIEEADGARLLQHFRQLLGAFADARPDTAVGELSALGPDELQHIVHGWNDTATAPSDAACIHELVERQAARTPDAVAVVQGADRLTYGELDRQASSVAAGLAACGVGPGDFVALHLDRTVHSVVALLGVLKSGAAYAPVESTLPTERIRHLLASLRASVVVCTPSRVAALCALGAELPELAHVLWVGDTADSPDTAGTDRVRVRSATAPVPAGSPAPRRARPDDLAYVIFTSGSTGTPKGVLLRHAPVVNLIRWVNTTFAMGPDDRVLFLTAFGFDLSVYDVFGVLAAGGSIRVATDAEVRDPQRLLSVLDSEPITFWDSAPAALQQLEPLFALRPAPAPPTALRLVFLSGDWIPVTLPDAVRTAYPRAEVVSLGGATEAAIWSNFHRIGEVDPRWRSIPYGRPVDNARYYILDRDLRPVPPGVPGDLYIGGDCLASGYHGDPALTAARFLPDPFVAGPGARMYHTGDRARFWQDGTMEFLGRTDGQVKLRGFRIELGEIEAALSAVDGVGTAVAHVHGTAEAALLTAYAVPCAGRHLDAAALREHLARTLPAFMVPGEVVLLDALPATPNGKLDRRALPRPGQADDTAAAEPATGTEAALAGIWAEVLGRPVGADSDFFALGGQSLLAVRAMARINATLRADLPLRMLLENPRLRDFAQEAGPYLSHLPA